MNVPNIITIIRILLVPFLVSQLVIKNYVMAFAILIFSAISDVLDGFIARKFNLVTKLGTVLDPVADKLMQFTVFTFLAVYKLIPVLLVVLLFVKEITMAVGTVILLKRKVVIKANVTGKTATVIFYTTVFVVFLLNWLDYTQIDMVATVLAGIAVISAFYAMASYARIFLKVLTNDKGVAKDNE